MGEDCITAAGPNLTILSLEPAHVGGRERTGGILAKGLVMGLEQARPDPHQPHCSEL